MVTWFLTLTGEDNPDLLQAFAESIALMEGTLLECQQSVMNGRLMALWTLSLPKAHVAFARQSFARFERQGLRLTLDQSPKLYPEPDSLSGSVSLVVNGHFRQGIDHQIRMILESHGGRVVQLNQQLNRQYSQQLGAANNAAKGRFYSRIDAQLSRPIVTENLRQALTRLAPDLEISLEFCGVSGSIESTPAAAPMGLSKGLESAATTPV